MTWPLSIFPFDKKLFQFLEHHGFLSRSVWFTPHLQLATVAALVDAQGAHSIAIEAEYIDRDFMEDYSIFYSRSLVEYRIPARACTSSKRPLKRPGTR